MTEGLQRVAEPEPGPWTGLASCVLAVAGAAIFIATSTFRFEGSYGEAAGEQNVGVDFAMANPLGPAITISTMGFALAGAVLAVLAIRRAGRWRPLGWIGLVLNVFVIVLFLVFVAIEAVQGG